MKVILNSTVVLTLILTCCVLWAACTIPVAFSCDSCGRECASACGTRHFRTCCFNYLRKRSGDTPPLRPSSYRQEQLQQRQQVPGQNVELWLARSQADAEPRDDPWPTNYYLGGMYYNDESVLQRHRSEERRDEAARDNMKTAALLNENGDQDGGQSPAVHVVYDSS